MLNVKDFGALGDGIHYDDDAFKNALSAVCFSGGVLFIPIGHYKLSKPLQGPDNGVLPEGTGITPLVSSSLEDKNLYQVDIQSTSGSYGTFKWKSHPLEDWKEQDVPYVVGQQTFLSGTPASFTIPAQMGTLNLFKWRGAGVKSLQWSSITLQGEGREECLLDFDFSKSGGSGDGLVAFWNTRAQPGISLRIADLCFRNYSGNNQCGVSSITELNSPPQGFSVSGSPSGILDKYKVEIASGGTRGTATFRWTRNLGGAFAGGSELWSLAEKIPTSGVIELPGTCLTITFPDASFLTGQAWTFEPTGYNGCAILNVGGSHIELDRVYTVGWKIGFCNDGGIEVHTRDCLFLPGMFIHNHTIGSMIGNNNLYFRMSMCSNIVSYKGGVISGRFGVLDFGGVVRHFESVNFSGCGTSLYFGSTCAISVKSCYWEGNTVCMIETDYRGSIDGLNFEDCYGSNALKIPFLWIRMPVLNLKFSGMALFGSPDGTTPTPYGVSSANNKYFIQAGGSYFQSFDLERSTIGLTAPGLLSTHEPFLRGRSSGFKPGEWSRHGINTINPQATLHISQLDTSIPFIKADNPLTNTGMILSANGKQLSLAAGKGASGGGVRGRITLTEKATTNINGPDVIALNYVIPTKQPCVVQTTIIAFINANTAVATWRQRATFENYYGTSCNQVGTTIKEWADLSPNVYLSEPIIRKNLANNGFEIVVNNGQQNSFARWTIIAEVYQGGDGG